MNTRMNPNSVVKLDVGGTMFKTTHGTLLSDQDSMLAKMFSTETNGRITGTQDENGAYFIDSCPKYFEIILNFLRRGVMENGANVDLKFLRNEAEYFCIQGLVKLVDEEIEKTEKREALRLEQLKRIDENGTKIGSKIERIDAEVNKLGRFDQAVGEEIDFLRRIDESVAKIGKTIFRLEK